MKLSGHKKNGKHIAKNTGAAATGKPGNISKKSEKRTKRAGKKLLRFITVFFLVIVAAVLVVFAYYKRAVDKPPPVNPSKRPSAHQPSEGSNENPGEFNNETPAAEGRDYKKFTFLILGTDDGNGNTDTIMVATFDTTNYKLNIVNIPRDTMVNVSWNTKKVNSLLANVKIDGTIEKMADILGYKVDYYAIVDLKAFAALVDAVGGVDYYIPQKMFYEDPAQDLYINFAKGMKHLSGAEALKVVRFRSYASGDIGRVETQQDFLMTAAKQILEKKNQLSISELADIFLKYIGTSKTNLKINYLLYFAQELFKLNAEDISFTMMPGDNQDSVNGLSYVTIYVDEWLALINEKLNPFHEDITLDDLSILTRGSNKKLYVTDGNYAGNPSWGSSGGSGSSNSSSNSSSSGNSGNSSNSSDSNSSGGSGGSNNSSASGNNSSSPENNISDSTPDNPPSNQPDNSSGGLTEGEAPGTNNPDTETPEDNQTPNDNPPPEETGTPEEEDTEYPAHLGPPPDYSEVTPEENVIPEMTE